MEELQYSKKTMMFNGLPNKTSIKWTILTIRLLIKLKGSFLSYQRVFVEEIISIAKNWIFTLCHIFQGMGKLGKRQRILYLEFGRHIDFDYYRSDKLC